MSNIDKAARVLGRNWNRMSINTSLGRQRMLAQALADAGLLMPDLAPPTNFHGKHVGWKFPPDPETGLQLIVGAVDGEVRIGEWNPQTSKMEKLDRAEAIAFRPDEIMPLVAVLMAARHHAAAQHAEKEGRE